MLHICCIRAGTAFAPAYVDILFDSVRRNLADGFEGEFVCFTDQPDKLADGIVVRPLPADLPGWWSKLALFRADLFPAGDRVLFFDLDTVITGRLDEIAAYDGPFAILRDFYRPNGLQSAVMAWEAGQWSGIWTDYLAAGCPMDDPNGDQAFIEWKVAHPAAAYPDILQDRFPDLFASFKLLTGPPTKASVVVFHGLPRPADVTDGWVPEVWKIGGMSRAELDSVCNTARDAILSNIRHAVSLNLPWVDVAKPHDGHVAIVGGGPSVKALLGEIRQRQKAGQQVMALNGAAAFLAKASIRADAHVMVDARPINAAFLAGHDGLALLASQCAPETFEQACKAGLPVEIWHANTDGVADLLADEERPVHLVGGGSTVGLNAIVLAWMRGYRNIHLYGYDSSFSGESHHAYAQPQNDGDRIIDALFNSRRFKTTAWMVQQVNEFQPLAAGLIADGCTITVHGDGLLPAVAADMAAIAA